MRNRTRLIFWTLFVLVAGADKGICGEYWLDNSSTAIEEKGTKEAPFRTVDALANVAAGGVHTIHIKGTLIPYKGGVGGKGLPLWLFSRCIIHKDESKYPVVFYAQRRIPVTKAITTDGMTYEIKIRPPNKNQTWSIENDVLVLRDRTKVDKKEIQITYDATTKTLRFEKYIIGEKEAVE